MSYLLQRLALMVPTLFGVLLTAFVVIQFVPGGPVEQLMAQVQQQQLSGETAGGGGYRGAHGLDAEQIEALKAQYGFDRPAWERFWIMVAQYLRFDLGQSYFHQQSVWGLMLEKLPVSISLGVWTFLLTYLVSVPLGVAKAVRDGTGFDLWSTTLLLVGYAIPGFVLGIVLIVLFGGGSFWDWFPLRGLTSDHWAELSWPARIADYFWHLALPLTAMVVGNFAVMTLLTKNSFLEELSRQYVLTARAKGVSEGRVLWAHVFRNAAIPLVTGFPAALIGAFFTGSLLIETLFSLDGLGLLSFEAVISRDYPVVLGTLYFYSILGLLAKLLTDLSYVWVDPRVGFGGVSAG